MPKADPVQIRDLSEGIIQAVDESIAPKNCVYLSQNLVYDKKLGRAVLRDGSTQYGSQIVSGASCLGIFQHITTGGTRVPLAVFDDAGSGPTNADIYAYSGGSWSKAEEDITAGSTVNFVTFLDTTAALNQDDACRSTADGTNWVTTGGNLDVGNMPQGKYAVEFKDRIYVAGVSGNLDRLYFSSIPSGGAISWTSGNGNIDIEPEEGAGAITGLTKVPGYVLIFKERSMKRWDTQSTYPESMITIGAPSQRAIVPTKQSVFYFNKRGIYETTGGYPRKISRRIKDIIDAIPSSYYDSVSGWGDGENVYFSIGDITLAGITFSNSVIHYNIDSQVWAFHTFPNELMAWTTFVDSNGDEISFAGDDDGNVWKVFNGTTDGGTAIPYLVQWNTWEFGLRGRMKELSRAVVYNKNVRNGSFSVKVEEDSSFRPFGDGAINEDVALLDGSKRGRYFDFRVRGRASDEVDIIGLEFPEIRVDMSFK